MNTTQIEREIKLRLDHGQYLKLLSALAPVQREIVQHNVFYDTPESALVAAKWNCRIRTEQCTSSGVTAGFLTVKGPKQNTGVAAERPEYEESVGFETAQGVISGTADLNRLDLEPLRVLRQQLAFGGQPLNRFIDFTNLRSSRCSPCSASPSSSSRKVKCAVP